MAVNNIKIFDQNKANMLSDEAYSSNVQRINGVQQGIASSQLQNKTLYQVSLVAYAIGQMMQANGLDANDADAVSTFANNMSQTIMQKVLDKANSDEVIAGTDNTKFITPATLKAATDALKASSDEAKNFNNNSKFITPLTWKVAYDFMKANFSMVSSATDDIHYITSKLLKEGIGKFCIKAYITNYIGDGGSEKVLEFPSEPLFFIILSIYKNEGSFTGYNMLYIKDIPKIFFNFHTNISISYVKNGNTITIKTGDANYVDGKYYIFAICA